ncbi:MAG: AAA family ATPase [Anaerostipes hadrus]|nr:AAA family ATPase [Anaerostipes hadrus]
MTQKLKLPIGIENFQEIRQMGFYYIDKTKLIEQLLEQWGKVNLFTRPRRFGKTLNMSMLKYFFEIGTDPTLFDGLYISQNQELCEEYMGKFPVIFLSLKGVDGLTFDSAKDRFIQLIGNEAQRFRFLLDSDKLTEDDKNIYRALISLHDGKYRMEEEVFISAIKTLSRLLSIHYEKKTIILIDEYDVPLDKAFTHGYYNEMVSLVRGIFGEALKTNDFLQFSVLTGCLRVSKESIFTGLNNFKILSITDTRFDEQFGFTDQEVLKLLSDYHLESHLTETKEWYDGYHFGDTDVYCPWDVINHVDRLLGEPDAEPQSYWINTSGNDLVKRFIDKADKTTKNEIERLIAGETIEKSIRMELTYDEIDNSIDNLWSILFTTGYLTQKGKSKGGIYQLLIPNKEVREVYIIQIQEWFKNTVLNDTKPVKKLLKAFEDGDAKQIEKELTKILGTTISILDTKARKEEKEIFYHGILLGLLRCESEWLIQSNIESGDGFVDILVEPEDPDAGMIMELKYAQNFQDLEKSCNKAMDQIHDRRYDERLRNEGRNDILAYGIAFCKKKCKVVVERL